MSDTPAAEAADPAADAAHASDPRANQPGGGEATFNASDTFKVYEALNTTFRFYIALTVYANLVYALVLGIFVYATLTLPGPFAVLLLIPPAMVSTGVAVLSGFGYGEALGIHRALQTTGAELRLPHVTRSRMLPVQTALTFIFHALISALLYPAVFFTLIGVLPPLKALTG